MFVELGETLGTRIVVNTDEVEKFYCSMTRPNVVILVMKRRGTFVEVEDTFESVKKAFGMTITPRAETIALR